MSGIQLTEQQRFDWLRLIRTESVGPRTFRSLMSRFGGAGAALAGLPDLARAAGRRITLPPPGDIEREIEQARKLGVRFVALGEAGYPVPLAACQTAPPLLAVRGQLAALARPMVALVGSRNASGLGLKFTEKLSRELGEAGFVVVSGLARGIDTAAHRAALATGTVAVLAGGHGQIYPPQNEPLVEELIDTGCAVSELPFTVEPRARDFPRRNRIVAGLSLGVVVVEAARKSGSLITARLAQEEGREVFAVPGSPLDPRAEGANDLVHAGLARLCRSATDIIEELRPQIGQPPRRPALFDSAGDDADRHGGTASGEDDLGVDELDWLMAGDGPPMQGRPSDALPHASGAQGNLFGRGPVQGTLTPEARDDAGSSSREIVADLLGAAPLSVDDLVRHSGLRAREVQGLLVELEMDGQARRDPSGGYVRA